MTPGENAASGEGARGPEGDGGGDLYRGRYRVGALLGTGGSGTVHRAVDTATGAHVALKRIRQPDPTARRRLVREIAALQLLRLDGVVRLLDHGHDGDDQFLVMELVEGVPFPGTAARDWPALRRPVLGLLEILARIHDAGVVHRDLKPENVLVRPDGAPVVLDFGLARGDPVGSAVTQAGTIVGTPHYLAPEQLAGRPIDHRTDLYSVGVLLYEALAGVRPHAADDWVTLLRVRLHQRAASLRSHRPDLPDLVWQTVDALLERDPADRPAGARAALAALAGEEAPDEGLPWLGAPELLDDVLARLDRGESLRVGGAARSGRNRLLHEIARRRRCVWTAPGTTPYSSLRSVAGAMHGREFASTAAAREHVGRALRELATDGVCVLVATPPDRWSAAALDAARARVVRVVDGAGDVTVGPLAEVRLRDLFHGPDRIFRLREDAAHELWRRTAGLAGDVLLEVRAWQRSGLCAEAGGRFRITRSTLDRLRAEQPPTRRGCAREPEVPGLSPGLHDLLAWIQLAAPHATTGRIAELTGRSEWELRLEIEVLEEAGAVRVAGDTLEPRVAAPALFTWPDDQREHAHRSIADALPPDSPDRLRHMLAAGIRDGLPSTAIAVARRLESEGRVAEAETLLEDAVAAGGADRRVLETLVRLALDQGTSEPFERAAALVEAHSAKATVALQDLVRAVRLVRSGNGAGALAILEAMEALDDPDLEAQRGVMTMTATRQVRGDDADVLARLVQDASNDARALTWLGLLRYRQVRVREALLAHRRAAELADVPGRRLASLANAASCALMLGDLDTVERLATQGLHEAAELRLTASVVRYEWLLRAARFRRGARDVDTELVEAAALCGPHARALVLLNEAFVAYRSGSPALVPLAEGADAAFAAAGVPAARTMAHGLLAAAREDWRALGDLLAGAEPFTRADLIGLLPAEHAATHAEWMAAHLAEQAARGLGAHLGLFSTRELRLRCGLPPADDPADG